MARGIRLPDRAGRERMLCFACLGIDEGEVGGSRGKRAYRGDREVCKGESDCVRRGVQGDTGVVSGRVVGG